MDSVVLDAKEYGVHAYASMKFILLKEYDPILRGMFLKLTTKVLGETIDVIEFPATWWDAFKERWFFNWAKKRWPITRRRYEAIALYPKISIPEEKCKIVFERQLGL